MTERSAKEIWRVALGQLELQVTRPNFDTWLKDTRGVSYQEDQFTVEAPNPFIAAFLEKRLLSLIRKTLADVTGRSLQVHFRVCPGDSPGEKSESAPICEVPREAEPQPITKHLSSIPLNSKYTFDSFVVGSSNRLAHAAAMGVAENPGRSHNPLFIYSDVGLGKTHLVHAIGHVVLKAGLRALYVTGEQFTNEFIYSIRQKTTESFRSKFRSVDILLVDDIQFISGKEQTQEGFFHTFNELHNANRQIVITSDRPPKAMPLLEDRLSSRFAWGLLVDIQPPDIETRLAILQIKAERQSIIIPAEVLEFIARKIQKNIRELEGTLNRVIAYARLTRNSISIELAERAIQDITSSGSRRQTITPTQIIDAVARYFNLDHEMLQSKKRDKQLTSARHVAMYLIREETNCSLIEIGRLLGGRDHSTVLHGCQKIATNINIDSHLRHDVLEIKDNLYSKMARRGLTT